MRRLSVICFALLFSLVSLPVMAGEGPMKLPEGTDPAAVMHNDEGIASWNKGDYRSALMHFSEASKIAPSGESHFNEAISLDKLGRHGEASMHFRMAKKHANGNEKILNSRILNAHL